MPVTKVAFNVFTKRVAFTKPLKNAALIRLRIQITLGEARRFGLTLGVNTSLMILRLC